jgi:predicted kinase
VCGPAGAGKSTHARSLEDVGYVRLSFDEEAWRLGHRDHPLAPGVAAVVHADLQRRLVAHVRAGDDVVVDTSFWSRHSRDVYRGVLAPEGVVPVVHYLSTPRDVVLARLEDRRHTSGNDVVVPRERALAYLDGFEVPTPEEGPLVVVDGGQSRNEPAT